MISGFLFILLLSSLVLVLLLFPFLHIRELIVVCVVERVTESAICLWQFYLTFIIFHYQQQQEQLY